ncbi:DUF2062 domain-containing protein [Desulfobulbus alkaliphilus]|uniref:DUF2062 domain-containing protein n=1 Tax=Desulfobulbus alkaliphilus TaxID=869814 RepID=UPI001962972A|nr:DUF2062 domain-containing protein [Desulfobulbus alkaliphilus]MBM9537608.1 DUF2062 domain-containing protein [Desulfobulbus alkaliphilus]
MPRVTRYLYLRFIRLRGTPHSLALGTAIGTAISIAPTLPFNTLLTLVLTLLVRANPIAGILAATLVSNPLTFIPHYYCLWRIGDFFLPNRLSWTRIETFLHQLTEKRFLDKIDLVRELGLDTVVVMMTGGLIVAIPAGVLAYCFTYKFFYSLHLARQKKHLLNRRDH